MRMTGRRTRARTPTSFGRPSALGVGEGLSWSAGLIEFLWSIQYRLSGANQKASPLCRQRPCTLSCDPWGRQVEKCGFGGVEWCGAAGQTRENGVFFLECVKMPLSPHDWNQRASAHARWRAYREATNLSGFSRRGAELPGEPSDDRTHEKILTHPAWVGLGPPGKCLRGRGQGRRGGYPGSRLEC